MARITQTALENFPETEMFVEGRMTEEWRLFWTQLIDSLPYVQSFSVTMDPGSMAANATTTVVATVNGVTTNDLICINQPSYTTGVIVTGFASAANTVTAIFMNDSGGVANPGSETYKVYAIRL